MCHLNVHFSLNTRNSEKKKTQGITLKEKKMYDQGEI